MAWFVTIKPTRIPQQKDAQSQSIMFSQTLPMSLNFADSIIGGAENEVTAEHTYGRNI